jgi:hypothetical protein
MNNMEHHLDVVLFYDTIFITNYYPLAPPQLPDAFYFLVTLIGDEGVCAPLPSNVPSISS